MRMTTKNMIAFQRHFMTMPIDKSMLIRRLHLDGKNNKTRPLQVSCKHSNFKYRIVMNLTKTGSGFPSVYFECI